MIEITGNDLSIEDIVQVARNDIEVRISSDSIKKIKDCRALVEEKINAG